MSEKGLNVLEKKFLQVKATPLKTCTNYFSSKQHKVSFNNNDPRMRPNILDLVHTDVFMIDGEYLGGASYCVIFIDDHTRKVWAFVLKSKDCVLDVFKHFHASIEREK